MLVYAPVACPDDLEGSSFSVGDRVLWVTDHPRGTANEVQLADAINATDALFQAWNVQAPRNAPSRVPSPLARDSAAEPSRHIILREEGVFLGKARITGPSARTTALLLRALWVAAAEREARQLTRSALPWETLNERLLEHERARTANQWQVWVSRARQAFNIATGDMTFGNSVIVTMPGGLMLGEQFSVLDAVP
jgi:hypothetical protein